MLPDCVFLGEEHSRKRKNILSGMHTMYVRTSRKDMELQKCKKWDLGTEMSGWWGELVESWIHYDIPRVTHGNPWLWNLKTGTDLKTYTQCVCAIVSMRASTCMHEFVVCLYSLVLMLVLTDDLRCWTKDKVLGTVGPSPARGWEKANWFMGFLYWQVALGAVKNNETIKVVMYVYICSF